MKTDYKTPTSKVIAITPRKCIALSPNIAESYGYFGSFNSNNNDFDEIDD